MILNQIRLVCYKMNKYLQKIENISIKNKYTKWYINIISNSLSRSKTEKEAKNVLGYIERHHILPKSFGIGGDKDALNVAFLSGREHFIVHMLLPKMMGEKLFRQKMTWAIVSMLGQTNNRNKNRISSLTYETAKKIFNKNNIDRPDHAKALKTFKFNDINGNIIEINNLPKFCRENNLSCHRLREVAHNKIEMYGELYALNYKKEEKLREFKDDKGKIYKMTLKELKLFCKENGLSFQSMRRLTLNVVKQHKNYSRMTDSEIKTTAKEHKFVSPTGKTIIIDNLPQFCKENDLNYSTMRSVSNGSKKKSKEGYIKYKENDSITLS